MDSVRTTHLQLKLLEEVKSERAEVERDDWCWARSSETHAITEQNYSHQSRDKYLSEQNVNKHKEIRVCNKSFSFLYYKTKSESAKNLEEGSDN
jgi:hypothetical protein